jgi:hypothetical protein
LAVVSTLSSFESLISPSHWLKKKLSIKHPKKIPSAKETQDEIQNLRTKYAGRSKFQHTESKHTTQPEP